MTLIQKGLLSSVALLLVLTVVIGTYDGSEAAVNSVKTLMGLNPMQEQDLVPLPGGTQGQSFTHAANSDDDQAVLRAATSANDTVALTVISMVENGELTLPDGRVIKTGGEAVNLDDFDW